MSKQRPNLVDIKLVFEVKDKDEAMEIRRAIIKLFTETPNFKWKKQFYGSSISPFLR